MLVLIITILTGCTPPKITQDSINIEITADDKQYEVLVAAGSTAEQALAVAKVTVNEQDRSEPPLFTVLTDGAVVHLIRVEEEFYIEQVVIPYEHQEVRNESLPIGETRLSQPGVNGSQEITYRRVFEDGIEISNSVVRSLIVQEPIPEIVMVGSQTPFASLAIPGRIAYLSAGNAWEMDGTTGHRRPVVTSGDLDGQIFSLSSDGSWLLFTRYSKEGSSINSLWAVKVDENPAMVIELKITNVVHFAEWAPGLSVVAYSTVEPRSTAPGWQANNDLYVIGISSSGFLTPPRPEIEINSGGLYGWWGMDFVWAGDGIRLAYARPDGVGIYDTTQDSLTPLLDIMPLQTGGDWAWVPGVSWGPDMAVLYTVDHVAQPGLTLTEESPRFDLVAIPLRGGSPVSITPDVGMFAYPVPSPILGETDLVGVDGTLITEDTYKVAYLQAVFPSQSDTSPYRLTVMDRDGSNRQLLFPQAGAPGLEPQQVVWSPGTVGTNGDFVISVIYQGNIWLVRQTDGLAQQITGDGLTVRVDWK